MEKNQGKNQCNAGLVANCDQLKMPIENRILAFRDQPVMTDRDMARLYGVETKVLNQALKRNIQRFPEDFMFQLTKELCLRLQIVTSNGGRGGSRYMSYVFLVRTIGYRK